MKKYIFFMAIATVACNDGFEVISKINKAPTVVVEGGKEIKVKRVSGKVTSYDLVVTVSDVNKNLKRIRITQTSGDNIFKIIVGGKEYRQGVFYPLEKEGKKRYSLEISKTGKVGMVVRIEDSFNSGVEQDFSLEVMNNTSPVAVLTVKKNDNGSYALDGSNSYDSDAKLGGKVTGYRFSFLNKKLTTVKEKINVSLTKGNIYTIGLVVIDNDGAYSTEVTKEIEVK